MSRDLSAPRRCGIAAAGKTRLTGGASSSHNRVRIFCKKNMTSFDFAANAAIAATGPAARAPARADGKSKKQSLT